jgi:hypothetical protein
MICTSGRTFVRFCTFSSVNLILYLRAVLGLMVMTVSQVRVLTGAGISCSQGLLANCPSHTRESGWKTTSKPKSARGSS